MKNFCLFIFLLPWAFLLTAQHFDHENTHNNFAENHFKLKGNSITQYNELSASVLALVLDSVVWKAVDSQNENPDKSKYYYEYNDKGQNSSLIIYTYDIGNDEWIAEYRHLYEFNDQGKLIKRTFEIWNDANNGFKKNDFYEYYYENDLLIEVLNTHVFFDGTTGPFSKKTYTYDQHGILQEYFVYYVSNETQDWYPRFWYIYSYNDKMLVDTLHRYSFSQTQEIWNKEYLVLYTYTDYNDLHESSSFTWDFSEQYWKPSRIFNYEWEINEAYPMIWPAESNFADNILLRRNYYPWNDVDGLYEHEEIGYHYYSERLFTNNSEIFLNEIVVFPNPVTEFLSFDIDYFENLTLEIFDIEGNLIQTSELAQNKRVKVDHLPNAMYYFILIGESQHFSGKFIKN